LPKPQAEAVPTTDCRAYIRANRTTIWATNTTAHRTAHRTANWWTYRAANGRTYQPTHCGTDYECTF
jgi:hypothetical protein